MKPYRIQPIVASVVKSSPGRGWWVFLYKQALHIRNKNRENNPIIAKVRGETRVLFSGHMNINGSANMGGVGPEIEVHLQKQTNS